MKKFFPIFLLLPLFIFSRSPAFSQEREDPGIFLERMFTAGSEELGKEKSAEGRMVIVKKFIQPVMDVTGIGLTALGKLAKALPPQQKNEYLDRFTNYFFRNSQAIDILINASEIRFRHNPKTKDVRSDWAKVGGIMFIAGQKDYNVWFSMRWKEEEKKWIVTNSGVESLSSTIATYQTEFSDFIKNDPILSIKSINQYLDCRLNGAGEKECKELSVAAKKGDG